MEVLINFHISQNQEGKIIGKGAKTCIKILDHAKKCATANKDYFVLILTIQSEPTTYKFILKCLPKNFLLVEICAVLQRIKQSYYKFYTHTCM